MSFRIGAWAAAFAVLSLGAARQADAAVSDLEAMQQANANLLFQYGFEGVDDTTRLADGSGNGYDLLRQAGGSGDVNNIQFVPGWDGVSQAYGPEFDLADRANGAGLWTGTTNPVPFASSSFTVEAVIQPSAYTSPPDTNGRYVLAARTAQRMYMLRVYENGDDGELTTTFGNSNGDRETVINYDAGDWLYVVLTASWNGTTTDVSWNVANLTDGDTSFTTSGTDTGLFEGDWYMGGGQTSAVGVGVFSNGTQEFFHGLIDSVALTNEVLSANDMQGRLDALNRPVPEPATFALMGVAGLMGLALRRRR